MGPSQVPPNAFASGDQGNSGLFVKVEYSAHNLLLGLSNPDRLLKSYSDVHLCCVSMNVCPSRPGHIAVVTGRVLARYCAAQPSARRSGGSPLPSNRPENMAPNRTVPLVVGLARALSGGGGHAGGVGLLRVGIDGALEALGACFLLADACTCIGAGASSGAKRGLAFGCK